MRKAPTRDNRGTRLISIATGRADTSARVEVFIFTLLELSVQSMEQLLAPRRSTTLETLPQLKSTSRFDNCIRQLTVLFVEALTEGR